MSEIAQILLIEDHPIVRGGCRRLLQSQGQLEIAEAGSGAEGLRLNKEIRPQVIVLDLNLPDMSGLDLIRRLLAETPEAKILVFSMYEDPAFATRALQAGATGYVTKSDNPDKLLEAVEKVGEGTIYLGQVIAQKLALMNLRVSSSPLSDLSPRELDILELLGRGQSLAEIAGSLGISYRTSANVAATIRSKLKIGTNSGLVKFALQHGPSKSKLQ